MFKEIDERYHLLERSHDAHTINEAIHYIHTIFQEYEKDLPLDLKNSIDNILQSTDTNPQNILNAFTSLKNGVQQAANSIPVTSGTISTNAIISIIVATAAVGGGSFYVYSTFYSSVPIDIINNGCLPIDFSQYSSTKISGLQFPNSPITSGNMATISMPKITVDIDATKNGIISIRALGIPLSIQIGGSVANIEFDQLSIIGQDKSFNLGEKQRHTLMITCK